MGSIDCATCGKPFTPQRAYARYCSNACRQKRYRQRISAHDGHIAGRGRPRGGVSEAARQIGVSRQAIYRALKIAGLSNEAHAAAERTGLDGATTALLRAAEYDDPAEQVRVIQEEYIRRRRTPGARLGPRLTPVG